MAERQAVYALYDPADLSVARYVGYTKNVEARLRSHCRKLKVKTHKTCWVRSLLDRGLRPIAKVLCWVDGVSEAWRVERAVIQVYRRRGWRLTNSTDGGEGCVGMVFSAETIAKISTNSRGRTLSVESRDKVRQARLGKKASPETRQRLRLSHLGKIPTRATRDKQSAVRLGRKMPAEAVERTRLKNLGRKASPATLEKLRHSHLGKAWSEKQRAGQLAGGIERSRLSRIGRKRSPETIERLKQAWLRRKQVPA